MEMIGQFIRDNWLLFSGGLGAFLVVVLVPALRGLAWKGVQLAVMQIGKAFMAMLTKEFFVKAFIWALEQLAKKTKGKWDDELVAKLKKQLEEQDKE